MSDAPDSDVPESGDTEPTQNDGETVVWSQPNQQVVRDGEPVAVLEGDPDPQSQGGTADSARGGTADSGAVFDPGSQSVAEVQQYVTANPDQLQAVLAREREGKQRTTLMAWLEDSA